jgi:hypothetical protein
MQWASGASEFPVVQQFRLPGPCPIENQPTRVGRQRSAQDPDRIDPHHGLVATSQRVDMRWTMIEVVHVDGNPSKL